MADEKTPKVESAPQNPQKPTEVDQARALKEQQDRIEALEAQNKELTEAKRQYYDKVLNGQNPNEDVKPKTVEECRKELKEAKDRGCSNREYAEKALALDDACRRETGESCFLPKGRDVTVTAAEYQTAENVHKVFEECLEQADGDDTAFNIALESHIRKK